MKLCYIPSQTPFGFGEPFVLPEIISLLNKNNEVLVIPAVPREELAEGEEPKIVEKHALKIPAFGVGTFLRSIPIFFANMPKAIKIIGKINSDSGSFNKILKNLAVFPKGLVTGQIIKNSSIDHIHCHWASTSTTVGYIASIISGVPFSFTAHRWDIADNNMLREKAKLAKFIRLIDDPGLNEMIGYIGKEYADKCYKIHVGVNIEQNIKNNSSIKGDRDYFHILLAANYIEKKGHVYLIKAVKELIDEGYNIKCTFFGDGPLENSLKELTEKYKISDRFYFGRKVAHSEILNMYTDNKVDCVALPSIVTDNGEKEGIPVSLMEAMAYKVPVISTNTGGIPELVDGKSGFLIEQKNYKELKAAIKSIIEDKEQVKNMVEEGYKKVYEEFYISTVTDKLLNLFKNS